MTTRSISPSLCGAAHHGNLAKLITLSGSFCTLCVIFFLSSLLSLSLSIFSLGALRQGSACSLVVYLGSSSGTGCYGRFSDSRTVSLVLCSQPTACLLLVQCSSTHTRDWTMKGKLNYFGHKVTGNQWRKVFFSQKEGGRAEKFALRVLEYLRVQTLQERKNIVGFDSKQKNLFDEKGSCTHL